MFDAMKMCEGIHKKGGESGVHWSAKQVADSLGFHPRDEGSLEELPDSPSIILDQNDIPLVYYLPGYFGRRDTVSIFFLYTL